LFVRFGKYIQEEEEEEADWAGCHENGLRNRRLWCNASVCVCVCGCWVGGCRQSFSAGVRRLTFVGIWWNVRPETKQKKERKEKRRSFLVSYEKEKRLAWPF
jgi:hypothetical protein